MTQLIRKQPFREYPEIQEVQQSKSLKNRIKTQLKKYGLYTIYTEEDIINEVVLDLIKARQSARPIFHPVAWARTVSHRYIAGQRDKIKSQATEDDRLEYLSNRQTNHHLPYDERAEIREKLNKLSPASRKLLEWHFFDGFSWVEIAELLSEEEGKTINESAVRQRGQRAKRELRRLYVEGD